VRGAFAQIAQEEPPLHVQAPAPSTSGSSSVGMVTVPVTLATGRRPLESCRCVSASPLDARSGKGSTLRHRSGCDSARTAIGKRDHRPNRSGTPRGYADLGPHSHCDRHHPCTYRYADRCHHRRAEECHHRRAEECHHRVPDHHDVSLGDAHHDATQRRHIATIADHYVHADNLVDIRPERGIADPAA
jgi:hypothetical protein